MVAKANTPKRRKTRVGTKIDLMNNLATIDWVLVAASVISFFATTMKGGSSFNGYTYSRISSSASLSDAPIGALLLLLAVFVVSCIGFYINTTRVKRKGDRFYVTFILFGILSGGLLGLVMFA